MTYNFFNTSLLAFGKKLTSAFKSLNDLLKVAQDNVEQVLQDLRIFKPYGNKNYKVPTPSGGDRPCRTDELYNLINQPYYFEQFEYKDGTLTISGIAFNRSTKRITSFVGSTEITAGSIYYPEAISNDTVGTNLRFYSSADSTKDRVGVKLCDYEIDTKNNKIYLLDSVSNLNMTTL